MAVLTKTPKIIGFQDKCILLLLYYIIKRTVNSTPDRTEWHKYYVYY